MEINAIMNQRILESYRNKNICNTFIKTNELLLNNELYFQYNRVISKQK